MNENDKIAFVILQFAELVKKFGTDRAVKILDCISAIHEATKDIPDDIKEDAFQWVVDISKKPESQ